ncbi:MAG: type II toxin-antitoxin system VapC family toxin, partial [Candidatus Aminicenantes bacterium]
MIVLDTHIWIWWIHDPNNLTQRQIDEIKKNEVNIIGISTISCWEIAKLVEYNRLELPLPLDEWFRQALSYPGIQLFN